MQLAYIGLGKMGLNMVELILEKGHTVIAHNRSPQSIDKAVEKGAVGAYTVEEIFQKLEPEPTVDGRVIWIMVPHQAVNEVLENIKPHLKQGDVVIDGGNTYYKDTLKHGTSLIEMGVVLLDAGVSGGPSCARTGAPMMFGGDEETFNKLEPFIKDISSKDGYSHFGVLGSGHFVKMVHNGIEYGMMQSIAEGFDVLKKSDFEIDLLKVFRPYQNEAVIQSKLIGWLWDAYKKYGEDLDEISDVAGYSGEGEWTIKTAKEMGLPIAAIEAAFDARVKSRDNPNYQAQIIQAMRGEFGGHPVFKKDKED